MLSYQHIYHAGNFADIHKHVALMLLLEKLNEKPKPYVYFDTHAGRGLYDLASREANKTGEYKHGIALIDKGAFKSGLGRYLALLDGIRAQYGPTAYPGSPAIAREMTRPGDRMVFSEMHPGEIVHLKENFAADRVEIRRQDAFNGLVAMLPPSIRRGLVLIDPSYEIKTEYAEMAPQLQRIVRRWNTAIIAVWYPILKDARHADMLAALKALPGEKTISEFRAPDAIEGHRMVGSGLVIFGAPWKLDEQLDAAMAELNTALFGGKGSHTLS